MSGVFSKPKSVKIPPMENIEDVSAISEDETQAGRREKRKQIMSDGKQSTVFSGIATQLTKRLEATTLKERLGQ